MLHLCWRRQVVAAFGLVVSSGCQGVNSDQWIMHGSCHVIAAWVWCFSICSCLCYHLWRTSFAIVDWHLAMECLRYIAVSHLCFRSCWQCPQQWNCCLRSSCFQSWFPPIGQHPFAFAHSFVCYLDRSWNLRFNCYSLFVPAHFEGVSDFERFGFPCSEDASHNLPRWKKH